jgi:Tfp pilus assembly protein PilF
MRRINFKFLLLLIVAAALIGGGLLILRRLQVSRNAGGKLELARQKIEAGKNAEAMELLAQYVVLRPRDHVAFAEYSKLLLGRATAPDATRNDVARAFNALETAVRRNPQDDDLRRQLVEFQLRIGRAVDARDHLDVLEKRLTAGSAAGDQDEKSRDVLLLKAQSYLGSNETEEAARIAAELVGYDVVARQFRADVEVEVADAPSDAYFMLAAILQERLSAAADAQDVLQKLVVRRPEDPRAWLALATWHRERRELKDAGEAVARATAVAPDDAECMFAEFELALAGQDWQRAQAAVERALELFPAEERAYRGLAAVAMQTGDLARAEQVLLDGVERIPGRASLLLMLTDALLQQNKLVEASQAIARIREVYGSTSGAVGLLEARLLVAERRWNDAKTKLEQVRPLVIGNTEMIRQIDLYLGQCHAQLDEFDAQLEVNRRILSDDPTSLAARVGAAQALVSAGQTDQALAEFEAIAGGLPPEQLVEIPQLWYPLLQLRIGKQAALPRAERDWSVVDSLLAALEASPSVAPAQLALLRAETLVRRDELQAARELLAEATRESSDPQLWAARITLVLREEGDEAALVMLADLPAAIRDTPQLLAVEAQAVARGPREKARAGLAGIEKRIGSLPPDATAKMLETLAPMRLAMGDTADAERLWKAAAEQQPDDLRPREALLEMAVASRDLDKARAAAAEVVRIAGARSARSQVAEASLALLQARERLAEVTPASGRPPRELPAEVRGLLENARSKLVEAEVERPGWPQIQLLWADIDSLRGDREAAIGRLQRAVAAGPVNPSVVRRLVAMLYSANRMEEAQQAMALLGDDGTVGLERISAEAELRAGKLDQAVALAEQSVAGDTQNVEDLLWLGQLLTRSGKTQRAGEILKRAAEVEPDSAEVWLALFTHRLTAGDTSAAERALTKATSLMEEPTRQLTLAQGYEMLGRPANAEQVLRDAVAGWPDNLEAIRGLAAFEVRKGRLNEARGLLDKILATTDENAAPYRSWARRVLAELTAERGNFRQLERALEILRDNRGRDGKASAEDLGLEISLLANRPEPTNWRQAITRLDELAAIQPLTTAQRLLRAELREKTGRWNEARDDLVALVAKPDTPPAYVAMLVEKLIDHGEVSSARTWLRRLQQSAPDSAITVALEAKLALAENDRPKAVEAARQLMPGGLVAADQPAQLAAVAKLMEDLGFAKAADRVLEQYASLSGAGVTARVDFLGRQGKPGEALDLLESQWDSLSLERALGLAVQVVRSQVDLGNRREAAARARRAIDKAKRIDPGSLVIRLLDAELVSLEGNEAEAEQAYRGLLVRKDLDASQRAIVSNNLAFHLAEPATMAEASRLIDAAVEELGPLPDLLDTRGLVRLAGGDTAGAVADLREACLQPSATKYLHLAAAELAAGDERAAGEALAKARTAGLERAVMSPADAARLRNLDEALAEKTAPAPIKPEPEPVGDE